MNNFKCNYAEVCLTRKTKEEKCMKCKNNKKRNYIEDYFIEANDESIPKQHVDPKPYTGPAEQTLGYECPVCHEYTNPYRMINGTCFYCGYKLFLKKEDRNE